MSSVSFSAAFLATLRGAQRVAVLTGAGISAESGVPTFRDAQTGFWSNFNPEELATPEAFRRNPRRVWEWYAERRARAAAAQPNAGHRALAAWEQRVPEFLLATQNVDGLHQRAGSRRMVELHGNLARTKCFEEDVIVDHWEDTGEVPPRCPRCGGWLRPDVVWFNEPLPEAALAAALEAAQRCQVFLAIGTSGEVYPAASLPREALDAGACVIEINLEPTPLTSIGSFLLRGPAGQVLPALLKALWP